MRKVLIVDDEAMIREGIRKVIPWDEISVSEVYTARSGEEALAVLKEQNIQVMMTDICMVNMDGLNLIEKVNEQYPDIRIIVLTGYDNFEYAQRCCSLQVQEFLLKPVDENELLKILGKQLDELEEDERQKEHNQIVARAVGVVEQAKVEALMKKILYDIRPGEVSEELLSGYPWEFAQKMQVIVILPILEHAKEWKEHYAFFYMSVKNICISMFDMKNQGITFEDQLGRITVAVFVDSKWNSVEQRMGELKSILNNEFDMPLNILVGSVVTGFSELSISYQDALTLLKISENRKNEVIVPQKAELRMKMFEDTERELMRRMEENTGKKEELQKIFKTYCKCMDSYNLADGSRKKKIYTLCAGMYYTYIEESKESCDSRLNSLLTALLTSSVADSKELAEEFINQLTTGNAKKIHEQIQEAKRIINENLSEELSVTGISEQLFMTTNYFSKLFKKETGEGCNEYIVRKRMEKAKSLLETTSMKSGKIAFLVGYKDMNYFSLAFKKNTGMSPTEYREYLKSEKIK